MMWALYIVGGLVALFALLLVWGFLHLRASRRQAEAEIEKIELAEIEPLARECVEVFRKKLGVQLDLDDCDDAAQKLDTAFQDRAKLKDTFAKDGFYWYFVKPVGAALGELLRRHARHEWQKLPGRPPHLEVTLPDGQSEVYPFDKVMQQAITGDAGDIVAYVEFARTLERTGEA
jgi:hypothetical protein